MITETRTAKEGVFPYLRVTRELPARVKNSFENLDGYYFEQLKNGRVNVDASCSLRYKPSEYSKYLMRRYLENKAFCEIDRHFQSGNRDISDYDASIYFIDLRKTTKIDFKENYAFIFPLDNEKNGIFKYLKRIFKNDVTMVGDNKIIRVLYNNKNEGDNS